MGANAGNATKPDVELASGVGSSPARMCYEASVVCVCACVCKIMDGRSFNEYICWTTGGENERNLGEINKKNHGVDLPTPGLCRRLSMGFMTVRFDSSELPVGVRVRFGEDEGLAEDDAASRRRVLCQRAIPPVPGNR